MKFADIAVMLVAGAMVGALASIVAPYDKWGFIGTMLVGMVGGAAGGWLLNAAGWRPELGSPIVNRAVVGLMAAVGVLVMARLLS